MHKIQYCDYFCCIHVVNKLNLMQVSRGNILKTTGTLCNPNFIHIRIIGISV